MERTAIKPRMKIIMQSDSIWLELHHKHSKHFQNHNCPKQPIVVPNILNKLQSRFLAFWLSLEAHLLDINKLQISKWTAASAVVHKFKTIYAIRTLLNCCAISAKTPTNSMAMRIIDEFWCVWFCLHYAPIFFDAEKFSISWSNQDNKFAIFCASNLSEAS